MIIYATYGHLIQRVASAFETSPKIKIVQGTPLGYATQKVTYFKFFVHLE